MDLIKVGLRFKHHCTTKIKKARPHSYLGLRETRKTLGQDWGHTSRRSISRRRIIL